MAGISFKEYIKSKKQLEEAVARTPKQVIEYTVQKYCKLVLGESKDQKEYVSLKPKQLINVEWLYEDINNPTPLVVSVVDPDFSSVTFWEGERLSRWLSKNTTQKSIG